MNINLAAELLSESCCYRKVQHIFDFGQSELRTQHHRDRNGIAYITVPSSCSAKAERHEHRHTHCWTQHNTLIFWTFQSYRSRWAEPVVTLWRQMSTQTPVHVSITSKQEQMNYHSHQSVFISRDGCQCRQSPAVPLLSCHFFLSHLLFCSVLLLSPCRTPSPTHSLALFLYYPLFPIMLISSLALSHSLHLSPLSRSLLKLPEVQASSKSQALQSFLTNPFVLLFLLPVNSAFRVTKPGAEGMREINRQCTTCVQ